MWERGWKALAVASLYKFVQQFHSALWTEHERGEGGMGGGIFGKYAAKVGEMQSRVGFVEDGRHWMSCTGHCLVNCDSANQEKEMNEL